MWIGALVGMGFVPVISDKMERRACAIVGMVIVASGIVLVSSAQNIAMFVVGRIICGLGFSFGSTASAILVSELTPLQWRSVMSGLYFSSFLVGSILASAVTYGTYKIQSTWCWRLPAAIQAVPLVVSALAINWSPESPRYLVGIGNIEYARKLYAVVENSHPDSEEIDHLIYKANEEKHVDQAILSKVFEMSRTASGKRRLLSHMMMTFLIEMGGSSVCTYYQYLLLNQAGITSTETILQQLESLGPSFWNNGFGMLGTFILPIAMSNLDFRFYYINAGYDLIFIPLIYIVWVETKGIQLEDIENLFENAQWCKMKNTYYDDSHEIIPSIEYTEEYHSAKLGKDQLQI
ncbi:hypothetical protein KL925_000769 [Ogataea polymorpha]|nr:hypothetical protein KL925_000769 [Ogataea polymorpha]